jgi:hypothetical protein
MEFGVMGDRCININERSVMERIPDMESRGGYFAFEK